MYDDPITESRCRSIAQGLDDDVRYDLERALDDLRRDVRMLDDLRSVVADLRDSLSDLSEQVERLLSNQR